MVPILIELMPFLILASVLLALFLMLRFFVERMRHGARLAAIEKGLPVDAAQGNGAALHHRRYLLSGLIWTTVGISLGVVVFVFAMVAGSDRGPQHELEMTLMRERHLKEIGATEEQLQDLRGKLRDEKRNQVGPGMIAVVGLVPFAVGVAYLVFFAMEERRIRLSPPQ